MSDSNLRNQIIRLAHANPELRDDLLPLLRTAKIVYRRGNKHLHPNLLQVARNMYQSAKRGGVSDTFDIVVTPIKVKKDPGTGRHFGTFEISVPEMGDGIGFLYENFNDTVMNRGVAVDDPGKFYRLSRGRKTGPAMDTRQAEKAAWNFFNQ